MINSLVLTCSLQIKDEEKIKLSPDLLIVGVFFENEQSRVRSENKYVAQQAELNPDRLIPFCSVNPLSDYALSEINWCGENGRFAGLKLHFANSNVDLRNQEHLMKLKDVFRVAGDNGLSIIVHSWTRHPDFGAKDVRILINDLLPEAGESTVQIAHLGGPGTFSVYLFIGLKLSFHFHSD